MVLSVITFAQAMDIAFLATPVPIVHIHVIVTKVTNWMKIEAVQNAALVMFPIHASISVSNVQSHPVKMICRATVKGSVQ